MKLTNTQKTHYILRIASAMCFIGHGSFGIITKHVWCNYFGVFGIGEHLSYQLMPYVGIADILCGIAILIYPLAIFPAWLVVWGFLTATLRPLSGEPFAELLERAGNFGAPLCLLLLSGFKPRLQNLCKPLTPPVTVSQQSLHNTRIALQVIVFLLLTGHGWLNLLEKKSLLSQYSALGFTNALHTAHIVGITEICAALLILFQPLRQVIFIFFLWKMVSELFYPQWEVFEWIERGGSYGTLLALWMLTQTAIHIKKPVTLSAGVE